MLQQNLDNYNFGHHQKASETHIHFSDFEKKTSWICGFLEDSELKLWRDREREANIVPEK